MRFAKVALASVVAAASASAFAAPPAAKPDGNKIICRTVAEVGTRLGSKRTCLTRDQWQQQKEAERQNLEASQRIRTGPDPVDPARPR
jgi:Spy/CpxP family protein refolding chaperone